MSQKLDIMVVGAQILRHAQADATATALDGLRLRLTELLEANKQYDLALAAMTRQSYANDDPVLVAFRRAAERRRLAQEALT